MSFRFRALALPVIGTATALALVSGGAAVASVQTDPPATPSKSDVVGVGSDTTQDVVGMAADTLKNSGYASNYNATSPDAELWSFDAFGDPTSIVTAEGCAPITRPNGSSAGISALKADQASGEGCIDYARSSRVKNPATDGDLVFVPFARDGVTWGTFAKKAGSKKSLAPKSLTTTQLNQIFTCAVTDWKQVGGKKGAIEPYLPQSGSGTRSFWLSAIGVSTPGACVNQPAGFPENDGTAVPAADRKFAIVPYSIAKYVAQTSGTSEDLRGGAQLRDIDGMTPIKKKKLNLDFSPAYLRDVFNVLKPADLAKPEFEAIFADDGFICDNPKITQAFGFGVLSGAACGY